MAYLIKKGDTLSGIAKANNTTVSALLTANPSIKNPNIIIAGASLNLPTTPAVPASSPLGKTTGTQAGDIAAGYIKDGVYNPNAPAVPLGTTDYSGVNGVNDANKLINQNQNADIGSKTSLDEPQVRKTTEDIMKDISASVAPSESRPETPDYTASLEGYRSSYGVVDLETNLTDLKAQQRDLLAQKQARVTSERGKPVAMNVISGRIGQVEQQENERLTLINNSIANVTDQLNMKYGVIDTLMKTKEMDYSAAVSSYDKEMSNNIAMYNAAKNVEEANKSELERNTDNARSNAQIVINSMTARGTTYDQLTNTQKTDLVKLGVQSGLGADFFPSVMNASSGKEILTTVVSADDTKATIIYKDGSTKSISTGLPAKPVSGTTKTKTEIKEEEMSADRQVIMKDVGAITGADRKVDPNKMQALRQDIAINNPELLTWFDNAYQPKDLLNAERYPLAVQKNEWVNAND